MLDDNDANYYEHCTFSKLQLNFGKADLYSFYTDKMNYKNLHDNKIT